MRKMEAAIIIGAHGFVGRTLVSRLNQTTAIPIYSLDIAFTVDESNQFKCDLRDPIQIHQSFQQIAQRLQQRGIRQMDKVVVFHLASYGMSSAEMVMRRQTFQVNVLGTKNVIDACKVVGVHHLVYTSTVNVVFGGQEIVQGKEESLSYFKRPCDEYSRTKAIAEKMILEQSEQVLKTAAIRSCAIYGPGEERHFPRIMQYFQNGFDLVQMGRNTLQDWIHVDDLVDAHIAAAFGLLHRPSIVHGQAYFVSEGYPCSTMQMMDPFRRGKFSIHIPVYLAYVLAFFFEYLFLFLFHMGLSIKGNVGGILAMLRQGPLMTRAEVNKVAVTHFFSVEKARRDLGWSPKIDPQMGRQTLVAYYTTCGMNKIT